MVQLVVMDAVQIRRGIFWKMKGNRLYLSPATQQHLLAVLPRPLFTQPNQHRQFLKEALAKNSAGAQVSHGFRRSDPNHRTIHLSRAKIFPFKHRALSHAALRTEFDAQRSVGAEHRQE